MSDRRLPCGVRLLVSGAVANACLQLTFVLTGWRPDYSLLWPWLATVQPALPSLSAATFAIFWARALRRRR